MNSAPPPSSALLRGVNGRRRWAELRDGADAARAPRRRRRARWRRVDGDAGARAAAAGAGLSVRAASVADSPPRRRPPTPEPGSMPSRRTRKGARQAERDAEAFRRNAPPPDDDTPLARSARSRSFLPRPSDAAPVVRWQKTREQKTASRRGRRSSAMATAASALLRTPGCLCARVPAEDYRRSGRRRLFPGGDRGGAAAPRLTQCRRVLPNAAASQ